MLNMFPGETCHRQKVYYIQIVTFSSATSGQPIHSEKHPDIQDYKNSLDNTDLSNRPGKY